MMRSFNYGTRRQDYFWVKEPRKVYKNGEKNSEVCVRYKKCGPEKVVAIRNVR